MMSASAAIAIERERECKIGERVQVWRRVGKTSMVDIIILWDGNGQKTFL